MKRYFLNYSLCIAIVLFFLLIPFSSQAQQAGEMTVASALICKNVTNREPVEAGTSFSSSAGRLYCLSHITGIQNPTEIVHTWYYGETQRSRVSLGVQPPKWRTYSSKIIQTHETGAWRGDILDATGNRLETVRFEIAK